MSERAAPPSAYGGQAVIEGVMIRGKRTIALACRQPDGAIYRYREALRSPLATSRVARAPFVRGLVVLYESVSYGMRMLMRSAEVQLHEEEREGAGSNNTLVMGVSLVVALVVFVGIPYLATQALRAAVPSSLALNIAEGLIRMALFLGYLVGISLLPDIRRVFAYHGAEHMTIHAYEHGTPLTPDEIEPYPTAHPRCGTAFLLFVVVVAIALFAFIPRVNVAVDLVIRLALVVPVASSTRICVDLGPARARRPHPRARRSLLNCGLIHNKKQD